MSSLVYGQLRDLAKSSVENFSAPQRKPFSVKNLVNQVSDAVLVLVPAEAIVLHTVVLQLATKTESEALKTVTTIKDTNLLAWSFPVIVGLTVLFYWLGVVVSSRPKWTQSDYYRMFLGGLAYTTWTLLQKLSVFTIVYPDFQEGARTFVGVSLALVVLGLHGIWERKR